MKLSYKNRILLTVIEAHPNRITRFGAIITAYRVVGETFDEYMELDSLMRLIESLKNDFPDAEKTGELPRFLLH
jgi:hypothetical protein